MIKYYNWIVTILIVLINMGYFFPFLVRVFNADQPFTVLELISLSVQAAMLFSLIIVLTKWRNSWYFFTINLIVLIMLLSLFFFFIQNWQLV